MSNVKLRTPSNGSVTLSPQDTASDVVLTVPATSTSVLAGSGFNLSASAPANTFVTDSSGNVGIGTSSPGTQLQIAGQSSTPSGLANRVAYFAAGGSSTSDAGVVLGSVTGTSPYIAASKLGNGNATNLGFYTNDTERVRIQAGGSVSIGTTDDAGQTKLIVQGSNTEWQVATFRNSSQPALIVCNSGGVRRWSFGAGGGVGDTSFVFRYNETQKSYIGESNGSYNTMSDRRLKENVQDSNIGLEQILALRPVTYTMIDDSSKQEQLGFIAQEIESHIPYVVGTAGGENQFKSLNYAGLTPVLVKAIQEQQAMITQLQSRIEALENA